MLTPTQLRRDEFPFFLLVFRAFVLSFCLARLFANLRVLCLAFLFFFLIIIQKPKERKKRDLVLLHSDLNRAGSGS